MNVPDERWKSLGRAIRVRSDLLGMSQATLARTAGISDGTLRKIEQGTPGNYKPELLRRLEAALQWEPYAIDAALTGRAPEGSSENLKLATEALRLARRTEARRLPDLERNVTRLANEVLELRQDVLRIARLMDAVNEKLEAASGPVPARSRRKRA